MYVAACQALCVVGEEHGRSSFEEFMVQSQCLIFRYAASHESVYCFCCAPSISPSLFKLKIRV